jgi:tetratricopeptide (TPR) repeat protein
MNKYSRNIEFAASGQTASGGKLSDVQKILKLAINSFSKEKYSLAIDYCRKAVSAVNGGKDPAAEAYYIWCLSSLKMAKPQEARKVCYEARLKLGNYLDLVYFETLVAAVNGELDKIPRFAESFLELYEAAVGNFDPYKEKTNIHIGEVLLMAGEALEQLQDTNRAADFYEKYLAIFPDDERVRERAKKMAL